MSAKIRVRFAPSPTGFMHLGNIRIALINYLFATQKNGIFVLRIEDTDKSRNIDEAGLSIIRDLKWLNLKYDEGPVIDGPYAPYFQSERTNIYKQHLDDLIAQNKVYRCFCSPEELEKKRKEQIAQSMPPRYDRTCLHLSNEQIKQKIAYKMPFVWRLKINEDQIFEIKSMVRGNIKFKMKNFSDVPLTRSDGSFTFLFANFIDDWLMNITHVIRGDDHLSNTAVQAALFDAFSAPMPTFWHLSMICNSRDGKKLSKRDFGFSLDDLKQAGILPQAICNYLAIIGGSFEKEIQGLDELAINFNFDHISTTGSIKYDWEKLKWINHKWINSLQDKELLFFVVPFLYKIFPESKNISDKRLIYLINKVKSEIKVLEQVSLFLQFCFRDPKTKIYDIEQEFGREKAQIALSLIKSNFVYVAKKDFFLESIKKESKEKGLKLREIFGTIRYLLTGSFTGLGIYDLMDMLENDQISRRLKFMKKFE